MMKMLKLTALLGAVFMLGACGSEGGSTPAKGVGSLNVTVQGLQNAPDNVKKVKLQVVGDASNDMPFNEADTLVGPVTEPWELTFSDVPVGKYTVTASALDADDNVLFSTTNNNVVVTTFATQRIIIVLVQNDQTNQGNPPKFLSVILAKSTVVVGEVLPITVNSTGGDGAVALHGRFWSGACNTTFPAGTDAWNNPECREPDPAVYGGFSGSTSSSNEEHAIIWTAPTTRPGVNSATQETDSWFVLVLTDDADNIAELGVTVPVFDAPVEVTFEVDFKYAPTIVSTSRVSNDGDSARAYLLYNVTTEDSVSFDYTLTRNCTFTTVNGLGDTGTAIASGTTLGFTFDVIGADRDANGGTCTITLSIEDAEGREATHTMTINTAEMAPSGTP